MINFFELCGAVYFSQAVSGCLCLYVSLFFSVFLYVLVFVNVPVFAGAVHVCCILSICLGFGVFASLSFLLIRCTYTAVSLSV